MTEIIMSPRSVPSTKGCDPHHQTGTPPTVGPWVEAAPFRAHLRYLMAVSGLSSSAVALLAGTSPRFAFRLLHGHGGRPLRRISPDMARKLLRVTGEQARGVRWRTVPATDTRHRLRRLSAAGWSPAELAQLLGLRHDQVSAIMTGGSRSCSQLVALRAKAEVSQLLYPLPGAASATRAAA